MIKFQNDILKKIWLLLTLSEKRNAIVLLVLMVIGMLFEMVGVGLIIPLMTALMNPEILNQYSGGGWLASISQKKGYSFLVYSALIVMSCIYASKAIFLAFLSWRQANYTFNIQSEVSGRLFNSYLTRPYEFHLENNSSKLIRNAVSETQIFAANVIAPAVILVSELLVLIGITAVLIYIEPVGTISIIIAIGIVGAGFHKISNRFSSRWGGLRQYHEGMRIKTLQEGLSTVKEVLVLDRAADFNTRYLHHAKISASSAGKQSTIAQMPRLWLEFIAVLGLSALVGIHVYQNQDMQLLLPVLVVFGASAFRLMPSINRVLVALNSLQYGSPVIDVLYKELVEYQNVIKHKDSQIPDEFIGLEFVDVNLTYSGSKKPALISVNMIVKSGEMIGLIGQSGAGKSTLVDVLLGLISPNSGSIQINGIKSDLSSSSWKSKLGYVPQSIVLIDDTIRRNVAFGLNDDCINDTDVWRALQLAQLDGYISQLPEGLETLVGERGVRMSGGQRQRVGVARALYNNPEILVLDEATSALDSATEFEFMDAIRNLHGKKTVILIAHRLTTVKECDWIFKMDQGRIVEIGRPETMLNSLNFTFAKDQLN